MLPGASAVTTALVASGLAGDGFRFVGYLPRRRQELDAALRGWRRCGGLVVAFETGQRLARSLVTLAASLPDARARCAASSPRYTRRWCAAPRSELSRVRSPRTRRGAEVTVVVRSARLDLGEPSTRPASGPRAAAAELRRAGLSRRDAAAALAVCLGVRRNEAKRLVDEAGPER